MNVLREAKEVLAGLRDGWRYRPVTVFLPTDKGQVSLFAPRVPGTRGALCVHPSLHEERPGFVVTQVSSGFGICRAPTEREAFGFGERLWAGLSDRGRELYRRRVDLAIVDELDPLDLRLSQAVAAGAQSAFG